MKTDILLFLRLINKGKLHFLITVLGLSVGLTILIVVALYLKYEFSFDKFYANSAYIYRVASGSSRSPMPLGPRIVQEVTGAASTTRLIFPGINGRLTTRNEKGELFEELAYYVDSTFLEVFDFHFVSGDPKSALHDPTRTLITKRFAEKHFPGTDPVGRSFEYRHGRLGMIPITIEGVINEPPPNSQFNFDILIPMSNYNAATSQSNNWNESLVYTYVLAERGVEPDNLLAGIKKCILNNSDMLKEDVDSFVLQPLEQLHFVNNSSFDFGPHNKLENAAALASIAILVTLLACINFANLSTAKAMDRAREIGIRKTIGASRQQLAVLSLTESMVVAMLAFCLSIAAAIGVIWFFPGILKIEFAAALKLLAELAVPMMLLPIVVGLISGFYPAVVLSRYTAISSLKLAVSGGSKSPFRTFLVIFQFTVTAILFNGTLIIIDQMSFIRNKDLGFDREQWIVMKTGGNPVGNKLEAVRGQLMRDARITAVSTTLTLPGEYAYRVPYSPSEDLSNEDGQTSFAGLFVDPDFITNMRIEIVEGRTFSNGLGDTVSYIVNQAAVKELVERYGSDWNDPIGKKLNYFRSTQTAYQVAKRGTIVGVARDFNFASLHEPIYPLIIQVEPRLYYNIMVKVESDDFSSVVESLRESWPELGFAHPFNFTFLDQQFDLAYREDERFAELFNVFFVISISLSCVGLYGMVLYTTSKKVKEITIRKVHGATAGMILVGLVTGYVKPVLLSLVLAIPISFVLMNKWLQQFAYQIDMGPMVFCLSAGLCLLIVFTTVAWRSWKASASNPVDYLRST